MQKDNNLAFKATNVSFEVVELIEPVKTGSQLQIGNTYKGLQIDLNRVLFTDFNYTEWIFYINDTCKIINTK